MESEIVRKNVKLLGLLNLFMDIKLYGAIAIIYFASVTGSMLLGMSIFSITMISATLFEIPTGIISDRIGRKQTVVLGTIASLIYAVIFAISGNYIFLVIGAIFEGLERALFSGNNDALLYDTLKDSNLESEYKTYLGKTNSMYQVAGVVGALIGGVVAYLTSFTLIMWLSVIPKVINLFISFALVEPKSNTNKIESNPYEHFKESIQGIRGNKTLVKQIFADSISEGVGEASYQLRAKFYEMVWPLWAIGIPSLLTSIGSFFSSWFSGNIIKKYGNKNIIIWGYIYSVISNVIGFFMKNAFSPLVLFTNCLLPIGVARNDISNKLYTNKHRASMASIKSLFSSITYALFALIVGFSADSIGIVNTLIFAALLKIIVIAIYRNIFKTNAILN